MSSDNDATPAVASDTTIVADDTAVELMKSPPTTAANAVTPPTGLATKPKTRHEQLAEFNEWLVRWNNYQHQLAHYWHGRYKYLHKQELQEQQQKIQNQQLSEEKETDETETSPKETGSKHNAKWQQRYRELIRFKEEHGDINVPLRHESQLGVWIKRIRHSYNKGTLDGGRVEQLKAIGFAFTAPKKGANTKVKFSMSWNRSYQAVKAFKKKHGHVEVPDGYKSEAGGGKVDEWIVRQRGLYRQNKLPDHLIKKHKELGINLEGRGKPYGFDNPVKWKAKYEEMKKYYTENGNCDVPKVKNSRSSLGAWVSDQRELFVEGNLSEERVELLNQIGFNFWYAKKSSKSADPFSLRCMELAAYKEQHGDFEVPKSYPANFALGTWLHNQRIAFREKKLSEERIKQLADLGVNLGSMPLPKKRAEYEKNGKKKPANWMARIEELSAFKEKHGHCNVSIGTPLGGWVGRQRRYHRDNLLQKDRVDILNEMGFDFEPATDAVPWEVNYNELKAFKEKHGHCNVPVHYKASPKLYFWLGSQRQSHKNGKLSDKRFDLLTQIGISFKQGPERKRKKKNPNNKAFMNPEEWDKCYANLISYKAQHGDCHVPQRYEKNRLGVFVHFMRYYYRIGKLSSDQIGRLEQIGFVFNMVEDRWNSRYNELKLYKEENGHCDIPYADHELGKWAYYQRWLNKKNNLTGDRIDLLNKIGFNFDLRSGGYAKRPTKGRKFSNNSPWERLFQNLVTYKEENGHCSVPATYKPNPALAKWVSAQRVKYRQGTLAYEHVDRLDEIGFNFGAKGQYRPQGVKNEELEVEDREVYLQKLWESNFEELVKYKDQHGDCNIPISYEANPSLGAWAFSQKMANKKKKLTDDRFERLSELGFKF